MKVAFVSNNGSTISSHFGRATQYIICNIEDGKITGWETREKPGHHSMPHHHDHDHHHEHGHGHGQPVALHEHGQGHGFGVGAAQRHAAMFEPIRDCEVLVARGMGRGAYQNLEAIGIKPIITDIGHIEDAVQAYIAGTLKDHPEKLH